MCIYVCVYMYIYNTYIYKYPYVCMCAFIWKYIIYFVVRVYFNYHHEMGSTSNFWSQQFIVLTLKYEVALFESQIWGSCFPSWKSSLISKCQ